ncbi:MAG: hypothetical protein IT312_15760, partial [Anaerolineales bacterium]|nr:hypothetical protein [Anaerolineales bacterium]
TLLFGLVRLIAGSGRRPEERSGAVDFGYRARGLINIVISLIALAAGLWLMVK